MLRKSSKGLNELFKGMYLSGDLKMGDMVGVNWVEVLVMIDALITLLLLF